MRKLAVYFVISIMALPVSAQDLIVTVRGDTIPCKIIKMDNVSVEYQSVKNGMKVKSTVPRGYVTDFRIAQNYQNTTNPATDMLPASQVSRFRWSFAFGYANRLGKNAESSGDAQWDRMVKRLRNGYSWGSEIQYYLDKGNGIALNIAGTHTSAFDYNMYVPDFGQTTECRMKQQIFFVGPAWATRFEADRFLFSGTIALGPVFYSESLMPDNYVAKLTSVAFGLNYGIGGEYKISSIGAIGLKIGYTMGATSNFKASGQKFKTDEPVSLSSFTIAAYFSFRTK